MTAAQKILLVIGIIGLLKSIWGLLHPASFKKITTLITKWIGYIPNFYGFALALMGVIFWIVILVKLPIHNWALAAIGLLLVWAGITCIHKNGIGYVTNPLIVKRTSLVIRISAVICAVISALIIWIAIT